LDQPIAEQSSFLSAQVVKTTKWIEARDLNEALRVASRIPPARLGGVEVRPMLDRVHRKEEAPSEMPHDASRISLALAGDLNIDTPGLKGLF
jgi:hypothetical protein